MTNHANRLWWLVSLGVSLWLCGMMIGNAWMDWDENPITMDYSKKAHISTIPFPTVTICPSLKGIKSKFSFDENGDFSREESNMSAIEYKYWLILRAEKHF